MSQKNLYIGTSGFSYPDWLGNFYPQFCPKQDLLHFYSSKFKVVEIDSTYYGIPTEKTLKRWDKITPDNFVFTAKFPKTVTHEQDMEIRLSTSKLFIERMRILGDKLGVLLIQFPYCFKPDKIECLLQILSVLPDDIRFCLELRNKCWLEIDCLFERLREQNIAFCQIDHPWMPKIDMQTADFAYYRFLGDRKLIEKDFSFVRNPKNNELTTWKAKIDTNLEKQNDCFVFFNNHFTGHSPTTAEKFKLRFI